MHELRISYSHTELILLFLLSWDNLRFGYGVLLN